MTAHGRARTAVRRILAAVGAVALLNACAGDGSQGIVPPGPTPSPVLDVTPWVAAQDGTMPLVLIAPHGGTLSPADLPDRDCPTCVTVNDVNTRLLALAIADAFQARVGVRPFVVANLLSRVKFDANRDVIEATDGYAPLVPMWTLFHERVDSAKARAARVHPRALVVDLHGHGHAIARLELGYLLTAANLRLPDALLAPLLVASSIARLDADAVSGDAGVSLVRGPRALGTRFALAGVAAVPSASAPAPLPGEAYFDGGYNTGRHGSMGGAGAVDAVQLEAHYTGIRDSEASRAAFAQRFVTAVLQYLADHYGWSPP